tara:strand:- start:170 stop:640 length:471 start_codon:yes stop_codon:yes gene_type:complete
MKLPLITYPTKSLQQKSTRVDDVSSVQELCSDMIETMLAEKGIGLAAVQIGKNIRLAIINKDADESLDDHLIIINPKIFSASKEMTKEEEGCLSIPGVEGIVPRHKKIKMRYLDKDGNEQKIKATNIFARVVQHEIDHINGILLIARATEITKGKI